MNQKRDRYLHQFITEDLDKKMVFLGGPRQVGKTTLSHMISTEYIHSAYLNWDNRDHKKNIIDMQWNPEAEIIIFDEVHKYPLWKSHIKGIWDTRQHNEKIIITGSARLDIFRRGGDSLLGRYHYYRLHPFSVAEINNRQYQVSEFPDKPFTLSFNKKGNHLEALLQFGGFPEPFLAGDIRNHHRWCNERFERIFREDIRDVENIRSFSKIELLGHLIINRVGSPLSLSSLTTDVEVSIPTVKAWLELLCRNYYLFKIPPYHKRLERSLKKDAKYYLWDWSEINDEGIRFEN
ncbi:MAG: ATP-binding protein, partial [Spirochaetales bacterium]|nr:ATP-binding protein [Spirochaetales bacterium]